MHPHVQLCAATTASRCACCSASTARLGEHVVFPLATALKGLPFGCIIFDHGQCCPHLATLWWSRGVYPACVYAMPPHDSIKLPTYPHKLWLLANTTLFDTAERIGLSSLLLLILATCFWLLGLGLPCLLGVFLNNVVQGHVENVVRHDELTVRGWTAIKMPRNVFSAQRGTRDKQLNHNLVCCKMSGTSHQPQQQKSRLNYHSSSTHDGGARLPPMLTRQRQFVK